MRRKTLKSKINKALTLLFSAGLIGITSSQAVAQSIATQGNTNSSYTNSQTDLNKNSLENIHPSLKNLKINGVWYISYMNGKGKDVGGNSGDGIQRSKFVIKRGYLRFTKGIKPWLNAHVTFDVTQVKDAGSNLDGSIAVRIKYLFGKFKFPDFGFFTKPSLEVGLVHFPWLDFEEHINFYRCQDTMFTERNGLFNSADLGLTFFALLGGEISKDYQKKVNSHYPGKYGSIALGIYNGAGYHGSEKNNNKPIEGRITIRPFPNILPGLQISYFGILGKGNNATNPDWRVNLLFLSYENQYLTTTGQYYWGKGNFKGVDENNKDGYSFFLELKLYAFNPDVKVSLIGRYDYFDPNKDQKNDENKRYILGIAYHLDKPHKNMILLDYDHVHYEDPTKKDDNRIQLTLQLKF